MQILIKFLSIIGVIILSIILSIIILGLGMSSGSISPGSFFFVFILWLVSGWVCYKIITNKKTNNAPISTKPTPTVKLENDGEYPGKGSIY